jgi:hypothetical protein
MNNKKKWKAEEEERHKGSLTQKNKNIFYILRFGRALQSLKQSYICKNRSPGAYQCPHELGNGCDQSSGSEGHVRTRARRRGRPGGGVRLGEVEPQVGLAVVDRVERVLLGFAGSAEHLPVGGRQDAGHDVLGGGQVSVQAWTQCFMLLACTYVSLHRYGYLMIHHFKTFTYVNVKVQAWTQCFML